MTRAVAEAMLSRLSDFVAAHTGLNFPRERWRDLERGIISAARDFGLPDPETCAEWLLSSRLSRREIEMLASHLTVGETHFFREQESFEALERAILPKLLNSRGAGDRRLRIWSAACCTGEEPYSIAITLQQLIPDLQDWRVTILATDINPGFLHKASEGVYGEWSFRGTDPSIKERFFRKRTDGRFEILPEIRRMVTFSYLNLAEDSYPSLVSHTNAMDVIFCRNVLMYFAPEPLRRVIQKLHRSLLDGGWLIVSPIEASHALFAAFDTVHFPGAILYRKTPLKDQAPSLGKPEQEIQDATAWVSTGTGAPLSDLEPPLADLQSVISDPRSPEPIRAEVEAQPPYTPYVAALELYEQGRYSEAVERLRASFAEEQPATEAMFLLARSYANQGGLDEALSWCEKAVEADKLNPRSHYLLATILQERGQSDHAVIELRRALYIEPKFVPAYFLLGDIARQQGKSADSRRHFTNALTLLRDYRADETVPDLEGITAGRLGEIIERLHTAAGGNQK